MKCKRDKLTGMIACFINEIKDYDLGSAEDLETLPDTLYKDKKGKQPPVRIKSQPDNVGLHTVVENYVTKVTGNNLRAIEKGSSAISKVLPGQAKILAKGISAGAAFQASIIDPKEEKL